VTPAWTPYTSSNWTITGEDEGPLPSPANVYARLCQHAASWLSRGATAQVKEGMLQAMGPSTWRSPLASTPPRGMRASWGSLAAYSPMDAACQVDEHRNNRRSGPPMQRHPGTRLRPRANFVCEFTIFRHEDRTAPKIEMGPGDERRRSDARSRDLPAPSGTPEKHRLRPRTALRGPASTRRRSLRIPNDASFSENLDVAASVDNWHWIVGVEDVRRVRGIVVEQEMRAVLHRAL